eukprot:gene39199-51616_t
MPSKTLKKPVAKPVLKPAAKPIAKPVKKPAIKVPAASAKKPATVDKTKKATTSKVIAKAAKPVKSSLPVSPPKKAPLVNPKKTVESKPLAAKPVAATADVAVKKKPGRPAKVVDTTKPAAKRGPKSKTAGDGDEDLSDVVAEFEEAPVADATEKVKPLRMKISKAKERALMKEFGLDETILSEEDLAKRRQRLKALIKLGKTRGYLTHVEISDHLPDKLVDAETMEAVITTLNDLGVAVYETTPDAEALIITDNAPTGASEEEAEEAAEAALSTVDSEFGRTTDPVRMYMREMGTVELLTREGEIEIAKRIEGGLMARMEAISASPAFTPVAAATTTGATARASTAPAPNTNTGTYKGKSKSDCSTPPPRTPKVSAAPIAPSKDKTGVPINKVKASMASACGLSPNCKPNNGDNSTKGKPAINQCA